MPVTVSSVTQHAPSKFYLTQPMLAADNLAFYLLIIRTLVTTSAWIRYIGTHMHPDAESKSKPELNDLGSDSPMLPRPPLPPVHAARRSLFDKLVRFLAPTSSFVMNSVFHAFLCFFLFFSQRTSPPL
jgi:hypothetical protein